MRPRPERTVPRFLAGMGALVLRWLASVCPSASGRHEESVLHIRRLASEMRDVVHTVESDLRALGLDSRTGPLHSRCLAYRRQVTEVLARSDALDLYSSRRVTRLLERLRNDHRRVVDLRSDVDRMLLVRRGGHPGVQGTSGSTPQSFWTSSGFHTRPSTVM